MFKINSTVFSLLILFVFEYNTHLGQSANILTIDPGASHTHFLWHRTLVKELVNRGHNVTLLTPDYDKNSENYTIIQMEGVHKKLEELYLDVNSEHLIKESFFSTSLFDWLYLQCDLELRSNGMKKIMEYQTNFFDLVIIDICGAPECHFPLIKKLGSPPVVATSPFALPAYLNAYTGDWIYPSIVPLYSVAYSDKMSFFERFHNFLITVFAVAYRHYINVDQIMQRAKSFYGPHAENALEIGQKVNVLLANIDPILSFPRPNVPNVIPVGGLHVRLQGNLATEVKKFLDNSTEGVVLFSLGTVIKSNTLSPEKLEILLQAFRRLPYKVLWKWESDSTEIKSDNVMIQKWLPQCDVLNHPNVKLFVTHGGELSTQEAIYFHKPMVVIPFFFDQHTNSKRVIQKGIGLALDFQTLTTEKMVQTINEVITNPKYRQNIERYSKLFRDQPQSPMERAVFWTEYVLRHKGVPELQSASVHMPFYQQYCLDIISTLLILVYVAIKILKFLLKYTCSLLLNRKDTKQKIN